MRLPHSVDRITLSRSIESLPPGYRAVLVLHDIEGYEHNEIADILELFGRKTQSRSFTRRD